MTATYDGGGYRKTMQRNGGAAYTSVHGPRGELQSVVGPIGLTVQNDAMAMVTAITMPGGPDLTFDHDQLGRETLRGRGDALWRDDVGGRRGDHGDAGR